MNTRPPCLTWAEKLALRYKDLLPADCEALAHHLQCCPICATVKTDYDYLDALLRTLPPPAIIPLPRLRSEHLPELIRKPGRR